MRKPIIRAGLLTLRLAALLFLASSALGQINPDTLFRITAKHSGKCLAVAGGPGAVRNGDRVIQSDCSDEDNQQWSLTPVGDDYYKILAKHSNKALDVFGGILALSNGVIVEQWDYNGLGNQMWKLVPVEGGYYRLVVRQSGKSLEINGGPGATGNGAQAEQWDFVNGDNQKWRLTPLPRARPTLAAEPPCPATPVLITYTFTGTVTLITTGLIRAARGPFTKPINLTIEFTECDNKIRLGKFPSIATAPFDVHLPDDPSDYLRPNVTTVTQSGGGEGRFDPASQAMIIPITFLFTHSLATDGGPDLKDPSHVRRLPGLPPLVAGPSTLMLYLATTTGGKDALSLPTSVLSLSGHPQLRNGDVTLVGSGSFKDSLVLRASTLTIRLTGTISPQPVVSGANGSAGGNARTASVARAKTETTPATESAGESAAEVAACKSTLQSGKVSWGGGTTWVPGNIDELCNGTKSAERTIACFQSNVEAMGWAKAIDKCK